MKKMLDKKLKRKEKEIKLNEKDMKKCKKTIRKIWSQSADEIKDAKNNKKETKKQQKSEIKPQEEKPEKEFKEKMTENVIFPGSSINQNTIESLQANLSKSKKIDNELKTAVKGLSPNEFMAFIGSMRTQANEGKEISYEEAKNAATTGENKKFLQRQGIKELEAILAQGKKAKKNESQYGKIMYRFAKGYKEIEEERKEMDGCEITNLEEQAISLVGRTIYEKLVKGYTEKQWGRPCTELPAFIIKRLPVRLTFDNNYFNALYQGIPMGGYTKMVENLLAGIEVKVSTDYFANKAEYDAMAEKVVYTGAIDAYFDYKLGALEYRSVRFETELLDKPNFQGNAAVNYTDAETPWTRIIEHKWFEFGKDDAGNDLPKTVVSREYSSEWKVGDEPYYPVNDEKNGALYQQYKELGEQEEHVIFGGRLGEYKYYDMDAVIASALAMSEKELGK